MIRDVDLVSYYLPEFMQTYKEPVAALDAEQPEFNIVWKAADRILYNHFISTADEYGLSRFEKLLKIYPSADDTLASRRSRVQSKWFNLIPYTWKVLLQKLTILCNNTDFEITHNFRTGYTLSITTDLELYGQVEELEYIIKSMIPENLFVISKNIIPCNIGGDVLFSAGMCFTNMFEVSNAFRETYSINSYVQFGGGIVQTDMKQVSDAFSETVRVDGSHKFGGGIVGTSTVQVTNGFNESMRSNGDVNVALGTVTVDFIEIK